MELSTKTPIALIINYDWDFKRKLLSPSVNPWTEWTATKPYATIEEALRDRKEAELPEEERKAIEKLPVSIRELFKKVEKGAKRGRKPKVTPQMIEEIRMLREAQRKTLREIAKIFGVDHKTILRVLKD